MVNLLADWQRPVSKREDHKPVWIDVSGRSHCTSASFTMHWFTAACFTRLIVRLSASATGMEIGKMTELGWNRDNSTPVLT